MSLTSLTGSTLTHLQSFISIHTAAYQDSMEELTSGNKYPTTADNPEAVCTATRLSVQINTNERASTNIELGQDMLSLTNDKQQTVLDNLQRIRDLTVEASNGTYSSDDKDAIISEIRSRLDYINLMADTTNFNDIKIMNGTTGTVNLQVGTSSDATIDISSAFINVKTDALGVTLDASVTGSNWTEAQINTYRNGLDTAINTLTNSAANIGALQNRLDNSNAQITNLNENLTAKRSSISDTDVAEASSELVQNQILQEASVSIFTQANQISSYALSLLHSSGK